MDAKTLVAEIDARLQSRMQSAINSVTNQEKGQTMPLGRRVLRVTFNMPQGDVTLDETLDMHVKIQKAALCQQQQCDIVVNNLTASLRASLITQFTSWNKRNIENGQPNATQQSFIGVTVQAGYSTPGQPQPNIITVFSGQVALAGPMGELPNMAVKITAYSQQISKVQYITQVPPGQMTFKKYAAWVAAQMGVNLVCQTSYDNVVVTNPAASIHTVGDLLIDIQNYYHPDVAAYVDNNTLYVRDVNAVITTASQVTIDEFINMPLWDEWGVEFECLFNPQLLLSCAATLVSTMNPSLNNVGYVVYAIVYDLTSRDTPFNMKVNGAPPA